MNQLQVLGWSSKYVNGIVEELLRIENWTLPAKRHRIICETFEVLLLSKPDDVFQQALRRDSFNKMLGVDCRLGVLYLEHHPI